MSRYAIAAAVVVAVVAVGCERADKTGACDDPTDDRIFVTDPAFLAGEAPGLFCLPDDGDGYPEVHPPITVPYYPTITPDA